MGFTRLEWVHSMRYSLRLLICLLSVWSIVAANKVEAQVSLPNAERIVFLGDSITYSGGYIIALETATVLSDPERRIEFLNLGLPSETVSGLSEPGHAGGAFPRPDLHERLNRVLDQTKPNVVVACYGMNDGIYYPLSDDRFDKFKSGMEKLHREVESRGANIIHLTPAFFDALPIRAKLLPAGLPEYRQPYEGYDDVLEAYSQWLLSKRNENWFVYDVHSAMKNAVLQARQNDPSFSFAKDGVHPNASGETEIAIPLAKEWGLKVEPSEWSKSPSTASIVKLISQKQSVLKLAWLSATGHLRPGIAKGLTLEAAQSKANELDAEARRLAKLSRDQ